MEYITASIAAKAKQGIIATILTFPTVALSIDEIRVLWLLVMIIIVDSIVAIVAACTNKVCSSRRMGQPFAKKVSLYGAALFTVFILSETQQVFFGWMFEWTAVYLIVSESLSIFENLSILGFRVPSKIITSINGQLKKQ